MKRGFVPVILGLIVFIALMLAVVFLVPSGQNVDGTTSLTNQTKTAQTQLKTNGQRTIGDNGVYQGTSFVFDVPESNQAQANVSGQLEEVVLNARGVSAYLVAQPLATSTTLRSFVDINMPRAKRISLANQTGYQSESSNGGFVISAATLKNGKIYRIEVSSNLNRADQARTLFNAIKSSYRIK